MPASNVSVDGPAASHSVVPDAASPPPAEDSLPPTSRMRESLDDTKRVFRTREQQAVEAQLFGTWMKEAGIPEWIKQP